MKGLVRDRWMTYREHDMAWRPLQRPSATALQQCCPEGRRSVATGAAQPAGRRAKCNPWVHSCLNSPAPKGPLRVIKVTKGSRPKGGSTNQPRAERGGVSRPATPWVTMIINTKP